MPSVFSLRRYHRGVYTQTERWLMDRGNKATGVTSITGPENGTFRDPAITLNIEVSVRIRWIRRISSTRLARRYSSTHPLYAKQSRRRFRRSSLVSTPLPPRHSVSFPSWHHGVCVCVCVLLYCFPFPLVLVKARRVIYTVDCRSDRRDPHRCRAIVARPSTGRTERKSPGSDTRYSSEIH